MDRANGRREPFTSLYVVGVTVDFAPSSVVNSFCVTLNLYLSPRVSNEDDVFVVTLTFRVSLAFFL